MAKVQPAVDSGEVETISDPDGLTTGGVARSAKLASIPLSAMGRSAVGFGRQMIGQSGELVSKEMQAKTAEQVFRVLGELKGGAMKFGQALSVFEAGLPEEFAAPYRGAYRNE